MQWMEKKLRITQIQDLKSAQKIAIQIMLILKDIDVTFEMEISRVEVPQKSSFWGTHYKRVRWIST